MKYLAIIIGVIGLLVLGNWFYARNMPEPVPQQEVNSEAKININTVCEGALAYMSFPSGAEADAWVAACIRGEHPEAIDQWKQMNGITDDRVI
jgi:hypothetical protein